MLVVTMWVKPTNLAHKFCLSPTIQTSQSSWLETRWLSGAPNPAATDQAETADPAAAVVANDIFVLDDLSLPEAGGGPRFDQF